MLSKPKHKNPMVSPGFRFWQTFLSWQRQIDVALAPYDLTQPSFSILAILGWLSDRNYAATQQFAVRQKVIVEMAQLSNIQVSQLLQRLATGGLIGAIPYELDRRERQFEMTEKGRELLRKAIEIVEIKDKVLLEDVTV